MCEHHLEKHNEENKVLLIRFLFTVFLFILGFKFQIFFIAAYIVISYDILYKMLKNLLAGRFFDECFLMSIATIGAICIREFPEAVMVMLLYQIGEYFQDKAVDNSKESITKLMDIRPDYANKITEESIIKVDPHEINTGDIIIVKTGEKIPLDGIITEGHASVDTSSLTGESLPRNIAVGDSVYSGCINLDGVLKLRVTKTFENSEVSKILEMVEHAAAKKAVTEKFITRFAGIYTPFVVVLAVIIAIVPQFFLPGNWIERALTFLVISCPCAFVISVPLTFFAGIGASSKAGILVKGSCDLEKLAHVKTAVFDKTGTLTNGNFKVVQINSENPEELLKYAAIAESVSSHPIAKAIRNEYGKSTEIVDVTEISGCGVKAVIDGKEILAGNAKFVGAEEIEASGTVVYVSIDGKYAGNIVISDTLKQDSAYTIKELNKNNVQTVMLTGDSAKNTEYIKNELGINRVYAELLPDKKVEKLEEILNKNKGITIFTGDGINDAPVLMRADVGIAMGGLGSDAAIEAADVVIMDDKPSKILDAVKIGRKTMTVVYQNIIFAIGIKVIFLILGILGVMTMWGAVFADVGVTFITILNALRILKAK